MSHGQCVNKVYILIGSCRYSFSIISRSYFDTRWPLKWTQISWHQQKRKGDFNRTSCVFESPHLHLSWERWCHRFQILTHLPASWTRTRTRSRGTDESCPRLTFNICWRIIFIHSVKSGWWSSDKQISVFEFHQILVVLQSADICLLKFVWQQFFYFMILIPF